MARTTEIQYAEIGERIRNRRLELGLTQGQLAREVGVSGSFIGHLERAEKIPSVETMVRLCACMDMSLDYLVLGIKRECDKEDCVLYEDLRKMLGQYTGR